MCDDNEVAPLDEDEDADADDADNNDENADAASEHGSAKSFGTSSGSISMKVLLSPWQEPEKNSVNGRIHDEFWIHLNRLEWPPSHFVCFDISFVSHFDLSSRRKRFQSMMFYSFDALSTSWTHNSLSV